LGDKRRLTADQILSVQAKKASDVNIVKSKIASLSARFSSPAMKAKLAELDAQLDAKSAKSRLDFEKGLQTTVQSRVTQEVKANQSGIDPELFVPGLGQALTKQDSKELKKAFITKQDLDAKLTELIALRTKTGGEALDREAVGRGKQLSKELLLKYKDLAKLGVLSESDMAIIENIIPEDPLEFDLIPGQEPTMEKLKNLQRDVDGLFEAEVGVRLAPGTRITPASGDTGTVLMTAPDGRSLEVPADKVIEMEALGAKRSL
jgi:hypothetical protein